MEILTTSAKQTADLGLKLAKKTKGGEIFALVGDLGGGKTTFAKGFARGLGIKRVVPSPSFILMKIYPVNKKNLQNFCHIDAYRLHSPKELLEIGVGEYLDSKKTITLIEWADKIKLILNNYRITRLTFDFVDKNTRKITISHFAKQARIKKPLH